MSIKSEESKFEEKFNSKVEDWPVLGEGSFGRVFNVENKSAVKLFKTEASETHLLKKMFKEAELLSKCDEKFVVKYIDSWIENNQFFIQMKLYSNNLDDIIKRKNLCFERKDSQFMSLTEYSLTSQLAKELTECVEYLHGLNPPIIHRDLKPANVLVSYSPDDGRYLKIGDFGLATLGDERTISHTMWAGTKSYMAPEVLDGENGRAEYSEKADIYSLGKIFSGLFQFKLNGDNRTIMSNQMLAPFWEKLMTLIENMTLTIYNQRSDCKTIIKEFKYWGISSNYKNDFIQDKLNIDRMKKFENKFYYDYFCKKIEIKTMTSERETGSLGSSQLPPKFIKSLEPLKLIEIPEITVFQTTNHKVYSMTYSLTRKVRGKCIIINNFEGFGLNNESKRLKDVFEQLHFEIILLSKLNIKDMITELENIRNNNISSEDEAFVLFVVSYGQDKKVFGYNACNHIKQSLREIVENNEEVNNDVIDDQTIIEIFSEKNCYQLKNKPKLHFFICCGVFTDDNPDKNSIPSGSGGLNVIRYTKEDDYSMDRTSCYSCAQGHGAFFNERWGMTYFTQALTLAIAQYACDETFNMIMSRTSRRLDGIYSGMPYYERKWNPKSYPIEILTSAMMLELFFNPGYIE